MSWPFIFGFALVGAAALARGAERARNAADGDDTSRVWLNLTGYWPYREGLTDAERLMEGGTLAAAQWRERVIHPRLKLVTVEQHKRDPRRFPFISLSGDPSAWEYGQRLSIPSLGKRADGEECVCRVVDTGGNFSSYGTTQGGTPRAYHKVYRREGAEPVDVCVDADDSLAKLGAGGLTLATVRNGDVL